MAKEYEPTCPVCGDYCDTVYADIHGDIVGCSECLSMKDAWETEECFPSENE